ncbi:hypothetical protein [Streptomyces sp. NPDC058667]|uniref:hypothetical protein n=1 Tax=Streptomyces sp. NPDC058667 TaxID=3346588 RepID=UPI00364DA72C
MDVAQSAVHPEERKGYIERLAAFVEQHRARLEEMLPTHGPGSKPASHGRYALVGQPETLVILERMKAAPFLLRGQWEPDPARHVGRERSGGRVRHVCLPTGPAVRGRGRQRRRPGRSAPSCWSP